MSRPNKTTMTDKTTEWVPPTVACQICGHVHDLGNGQLAFLERGKSSALTDCQVCGRKTWSAPFVLRAMTRADIEAALRAPEKQPD